MSDKNIFDKLYSTIMEADDELGDALDVDFGGEEEELGVAKEPGHDSGEVVGKTLIGIVGVLEESKDLIAEL